MSAKLSTKIKVNRLISRPRHAAKKRKFVKKQNYRKMGFVATCFFYFFVFMTAFGGFNYLSALNKDLPPIDTAFSAYGLASTIFDRNGTELYTIANNFLREPLNLKDVPPHVVWAFLAAEDLHYYEHEGIEPSAMARCALIVAQGGSGSICGGSTITQQLVKMTAVGNELSVERKLREIIMATKLEGKYGKNKILEQYLSVVPMGSNIYGITVGAQFYFGKKVKDLTLGEAALLASIIQNPVHLSPTLGYPDKQTAQKLVLERRDYVFGQLEKNMDYINDMVRKIADDVELDDAITKEMLAAARKQPLKYKAPVFTDKKAGHFVDYAQYLLTTRPYNKGKPFTAAELAFGGYTIYTTLDYKLQKVAEDTVLTAVRSGKEVWGAHNAAMLTMQPATGEILVMVGSRSYYQESTGCNRKGDNCLFNPQVNIMTTKHSPGSSTKPFGYYEAYRQGKLYTGSLLPDVPVNVGGGYRLKNWNSTFFGVSPKTFAGQMLCESRNLPAVIALETIGVPSFLKTMRAFGYTSYNTNAGKYGHSVILGGADVIGVEHAQGYGVLANNGKLVQNEAIRKIVDKNGEVVYEHKPKPKQVGDPRAAYMVNHSLLGCAQSSWDGRQVGAKTGTAQNNTDVWVVMYSPDFVTLGWMGNNNNRRMKPVTYGENAIMPWLKGYMRQVGNTKYFDQRTKFRIPKGVEVGGGNGTGYVSGIKYSGRPLRVEVSSRYVRVCVDQMNRLARPIDIAKGKAVTRRFTYFRMPVPHWQQFLDAYLSRRGFGNGGIPTAYCTVNRN